MTPLAGKRLAAAGAGVGVGVLARELLLELALTLATWGGSGASCGASEFFNCLSDSLPDLVEILFRLLIILVVMSGALVVGGLVALILGLRRRDRAGLLLVGCGGAALVPPLWLAVSIALQS